MPSALCNPHSLALFQHSHDHSSRHDRCYRVCADKPRAFKIADDAQKLKVSVEQMLLGYSAEYSRSSVEQLIAVFAPAASRVRAEAMGELRLGCKQFGTFQYSTDKRLGRERCDAETGRSRKKNEC